MERLREAGIDVERVAAYKTVTIEDPSIAQAADDADIITFASPSAAIAFSRNAGTSRRAIVACIGDASAQAARACGLRVDVVARESTSEGIVAALEAFLGGRSAWG